MRFLAGCLLGSVLSTAGGVFVVNTWFRPAVETYPEFKQLAADKVKAEQERDAAKREVLLLRATLDYRKQLDAAYNADPNRVNPGGAVVPATDRIPAPAVPFPTVPCEPGKRRD